jgi:tRNA dimethylallyltransferase
MSLPKAVFITGPTAAGKSAVGLALAERLGGEIVSCDSMQVYREINIASNKPGTAERKRAPHHMLDVVSVTETYDVARYNNQAREVIDGVVARGRLPVIVGGSGLYLQVLLDGIFAEGSNDEGVRKILESRASGEGLEALYAELREADPESASIIHCRDRKRVIRALEAFRVSGTPFSELRKKREGMRGRYDISVIVLNQERSRLYEAINLRVDEMFNRGLVDEVRGLQPLPLSRTARYLIGVREILAWLEGQCTLEESEIAMKQNTRRYAKRQLTWFRKDARFQWVDAGAGATASRITERIISKFENTD